MVRHALRSVAALCFLASLTACSPAQSSPSESGSAVILISLDGFRWDFVERTETPSLDQLIADGVRAERLIPVFPTKTFPNHHSIATGLYPSEHGVVSNTMYDPEFDARFGIRDRDAVSDPRWYGGEPIWVTAEQQDLVAATFFWPGTDVPIQGVLPTHFRQYDGSVPNMDRVEQVLAWLDLPEGERPSFVTLYFSEVDSQAHRFNPDTATAVEMAIRNVDAAIGVLLRGLDVRDLRDDVNLIVVSDHGMAATSRQRVIFVDDYVDLEMANVVDWNPVLALWPVAAQIDTVYAALAGAHSHLKVYRKEEIPERFVYRTHRRIPPILGIADEGWSITDRRFFERDPDRFDGGAHGYDHELESMGALFIADGPAFQSGVTVPPFQNIHIYNLICHILGLRPAPNSGNLDAVRALLN